MFTQRIRKEKLTLTAASVAAFPAEQVHVATEKFQGVQTWLHRHGRAKGTAAIDVPDNTQTALSTRMFSSRQKKSQETIENTGDCPVFSENIDYLFHLFYFLGNLLVTLTTMKMIFCRPIFRKWENQICA